MSEKINVPEQAAEEPCSIMQNIQNMIGNLLVDSVDKLQKTEISKKLGETPENVSDSSDLPAQMGIDEIKTFVSVMQKFIDNVNVVIAQLETGSPEAGGTDDKFLEGYMATADNVLELAAFSMKDPLTGLSNRYGFDNRLILEWNRAVRDKSALSLVIFNIDSITMCKDSGTRDELLKAISEILDISIKRTTDFISRWSDDEFAALLPITGTDGVTIVAERIYKELRDMDLTAVDGKASISIGVGVHAPESGERPIDFINKTYNAFTKAKETNESKIIYS